MDYWRQDYGGGLKGWEYVMNVQALVTGSSVCFTHGVEAIT